MTNYKALVKGLVAEFQATEKSSVDTYRKVVQSRNLPEQQEALLLNFAADYWAIQTYSEHQNRTRSSTGLEDFGIVGSLELLIFPR